MVCVCVCVCKRNKVKGGKESEGSSRVGDLAVVGRAAEGEAPEAALQVVARLLRRAVVAPALALVHVCRRATDTRFNVKIFITVTKPG